jgi:ABC-type transporter Mla MlaB component
MLRITLHDTPQEVILELEGSLAGTWVTELEDSWRAANSSLATRLLCVDLTAVDYVDEAGKYLLALLRDRGVRLIASGLLMTEFVATLLREWHLQEGRANVPVSAPLTGSDTRDAVSRRKKPK